MLVLRGSATLALAGYTLALSGETVPLTLLGYAPIGLGMANIVPILFSLGGSQQGVGQGSGIAAVATAGYSGFLLLLVVFGGRVQRR